MQIAYQTHQEKINAADSSDYLNLRLQLSSAIYDSAY